MAVIMMIKVYLYDNVYHSGVYNPKNLGNDKGAVVGYD